MLYIGDFSYFVCVETLYFAIQIGSIASNLSYFDLYLKILNNNVNQRRSKSAYE